MRYRDKLEEFKGGKNKIGDFISGFNRAYCKEKVILDEMSLFGIFPLDSSSMVSMKVYVVFLGYLEYLFEKYEWMWDNISKVLT